METPKILRVLNKSLIIAVAISRLKFCGFIKIMNLQARKLLLGRISSDTSPLQKIDIFSKTQ